MLLTIFGRRRKKFPFEAETAPLRSDLFDRLRVRFIKIFARRRTSDSFYPASFTSRRFDKTSLRYSNARKNKAEDDYFSPHPLPRYFATAFHRSNSATNKYRPKQNESRAYRFCCKSLVKQRNSVRNARVFFHRGFSNVSNNEQRVRRVEKI